MEVDDWFLLGVPWDCSASGRAEQDAPQAFREAGITRLAGRDIGDAETHIGTTGRRDANNGVLALHETVAAAKALGDTLAGALREFPGRRPLVIGGDCSMLLGIFPALRRSGAAPGLWFFDAHPDFLDGQTSETGETADMELAILTGHGPGALVALSGDPPMVRPRDVVLLGHRTSGLEKSAAAEVARVPGELRRADATALVTDPGAVGRAAADWLAACDGVWLHLDLDVVDATCMPAVTYPEPDGPDWDQLTAALEPLARSPRLLGVSIADYRPDLDPSRELAHLVIDLLARTLP